MSGGIGESLHPTTTCYNCAGTIPGWKAPPVTRVSLFEPHERFNSNESQIAQDALFSFEKTIVPITIANTNNEVLTLYKDTTLGLSQLVSDRLIQEVNQKQTKDYNEADPKYDLENVKKALNKEIINNCRADFRKLIDDFSDIFSINQWDLGLATDQTAIQKNASAFQRWLKRKTRCFHDQRIEHTASQSIQRASNATTEEKWKTTIGERVQKTQGTDN